MGTQSQHILQDKASLNPPYRPQNWEYTETLQHALYYFVHHDFKWTHMNVTLEKPYIH